ncbi:hypothetical protein [Mycolicibacterium sp. F2034L]|uniref:hypothetical protein n=1 Tax=Mycolicibacterium sp. F2034L TaxID=2926422 RepID=UPI001FF4BB96|nr:hypothetical protein [Mycolicibacterium sp. F2034L]MCK0174822.1 hypothetical protein [Mycolicibacterium sp. F2034L]
MRDLETIDSELSLIATMRRCAREGGHPVASTALADQLLDERLRCPPVAVGLEHSGGRE